MSKAQITIPLDIPDVRVLQTALGERGELIITIESTKDGTRCRKCGRWIQKLHGRDEWVTIQHLPAFGRATYLRYRPKRYQCQACEGQPTTTAGSICDALPERRVEMALRGLSIRKIGEPVIDLLHRCCSFPVDRTFD